MSEAECRIGEFWQCRLGVEAWSKSCWVTR